MLEHQIKGLEEWRDVIARGEQGKVDAQSEIRVINAAISTIKDLSAKLAAVNMERSLTHCNSGWIPVEDRLPDLDERGYSKKVLVWEKAHLFGDEYYRIGFYMGNRWDNSLDVSKVLAWMPLPEGYKEEV